MKKWILALFLVYSSVYGSENKFVSYLKNDKTVLDLNDKTNWEQLKMDAEQNQFLILGIITRGTICTTYRL